MGLLDDAIREHLELKRRKGADPGAVAREEQDALGPVRRGQDAERDHMMVERASTTADDQEPVIIADLPPVGDSAAPASSGQETVEINMEAELAAENDVDAPAKPDLRGRARPVAHPAGARTIGDESLEWEASDSDGGSDLSTKHGGGQDVPVGGDDQNEPIEDVLEETPDFLRETPEQERLWFEQRPPRDFDFNE
jgi:hypothetical protein